MLFYLPRSFCASKTTSLGSVHTPSDFLGTYRPWILMYLEPRSIALFIKSLNVGVGRSQNLREHLGPSPFEFWDPEQFPFARLRIAVGVCWTQIPCEGCSFSHLMGRHTVPGTTGVSSEEEGTPGTFCACRSCLLLPYTGSQQAVCKRQMYVLRVVCSGSGLG